MFGTFSVIKEAAYREGSVYNNGHCNLIYMPHCAEAGFNINDGYNLAFASSLAVIIIFVVVKSANNENINGCLV